MHAEKGAPEEGTYRFVLTRFDWNPDIAYLEQNYGEVRRSRCVQWPTGLALPKRRPDMDRWRPKGPDDNPPGGEHVTMIFCNDPHFRTRLTKLGWLDISEPWKRFHAGEVDAPPTVPDVPDGLRFAIGAPVGVLVGERRSTPRGATP